MSHSISFTGVDSPPRNHSPLMDSQDSSSAAAAPAPPSLHHHQQQQPLLQHHHQNMMVVGPPPQTQPHHLQQQPPPNSYPAFHSSVAANNTMPHQQQNQLQQQHQQQSRFPFSSMVNSAPPQLMPMDYSDGGNVTSPPTGGVVGSGSGMEVVKRKRGRPRKNPSDGAGTGIALGLPPNPTVAVTESGGGGAGAGDTFSSEAPVKKHRGRPPGSGKKQLDALGIPGVGLTPHVILVKPGEDIATRIMDFSQQGPRTICIVNANGAISNATLRQSASSGSNSTVMYEGIFEIVSLSGSFLMSDNNGGSNRTGGLSVSLAREDGSLLGGGVAGMLKAATPVQIIVASFILDGKKTKSMAAVVPPPNMSSFANLTATEASPSSQGGRVSSNSSDDNGSPLDQGAYVNAAQLMQNVPMYWGNNTMNMHPN